MFALILQSDKSQKVLARQGPSLEPVFEAELSGLDSVTAISIAQTPGDSKNLLVLTTEASQTKSSELLFFEVGHESTDGASRLSLLFKSAKVNEQLPILPNQLRSAHTSLAGRAFTDLSIDINATSISS